MDWASGVALGDWLGSINTSLTAYKQQFEEYGYENMGMLLEETDSDLILAFEELNVKKPHRRLLMKHLHQLKGHKPKGQTN